jgi:type IV pilus biogenesis protein PilP
MFNDRRDLKGSPSARAAWLPCAVTVAIAVSLFAGTSAASADEASSTVPDAQRNANGDAEAVVGDLERVQTATIMATARLNLKKQQDELDGGGGHVGASSIAPVLQAADNVLPNVRLIINDTASFIFSDGSRAAGKVGSTLPGGWKVKQIVGADRSVVVADKSGREYHLAMSSSAPQDLNMGASRLPAMAAQMPTGMGLSMQNGRAR